MPQEEEDKTADISTTEPVQESVAETPQPKEPESIEPAQEQIPAPVDTTPVSESPIDPEPTDEQQPSEQSPEAEMKSDESTDPVEEKPSPTLPPIPEPAKESEPPAPEPTPTVAQATVPTRSFVRDLLIRARARIQERKGKKLNKIMEKLSVKNKISNDDVQKLLYVSDATATRYLSILEKQGKIKQEGKTGKAVYYSKV